MRIKALKQLLWIVNALLVLGVVGVVMKFFFLAPTNRKLARSAEDILGEVIQQGRRTIERTKPDPAHTYRFTHELAIFGAPPPPPEVANPETPVAQRSPLARNYELMWTLLDPRGWGSYAHLAKLPDRKTLTAVEVGEKVDGAWKLIRVSLTDAEFEDEVTGDTVTLERVTTPTIPLNDGSDSPNSGDAELPPGMEVAKRTPEEDFRLGPVKSALKKGENHWEMPAEEGNWLGRNGEQVASQLTLKPEQDPATGRPDGVRVVNIAEGSIARSRGLLPGDKVKSINGTPVNSRGDAISYLKGPGKGLNRYLVVIERKGKIITMTYDVRK